MEKMAIRGGKPAREVPLPPNYPGAVMYGEEEAKGTNDVIHAKSPFRYYGPSLQNKVNEFEMAMMQFLGTDYSLGVTSGTAALIVGMKALGIGYGDKVIVPAHTFVATAGAVLCCNAVPVFADVDDSLNMDPNDLERVMDDEVKAIITVPILGNPCDMDPIMAFAKQKRIHVIEDVAQSCGVKYKGNYQGTIGDIGAFSFQMNKVLTAGEGGAVTTNDATLFERAVRYHDQGTFRRPEFYGMKVSQLSMLGQNYRMSEPTGAILLEQWKKLDLIVSRMQISNRTVRESLQAKLPEIKFRSCPDPEGDIGSNLGMIFSTQSQAFEFNKAMHAENIDTAIIYGGKPVYTFPQFLQKQTGEKDHFPYNYPFRNPVKYSADMCPNACDLIPRTVYLPISPMLREKDIKQIIEGTVKVYRGLFA